MHELSIAESLIASVKETADREKAVKVLKVTVAVGSLSGVVPDALMFCWDAVKKNGIAESAELVIEEVKAEAYCHKCEKKIELGVMEYACRICGETLFPSGGRELYIRDMEVE